MYIIAFALILIVHSSIIKNLNSATVFLEVDGLLPYKKKRENLRDVHSMWVEEQTLISRMKPILKESSITCWNLNAKSQSLGLT